MTKILILPLLILTYFTSFGQDSDSTFIFESPRPLVQTDVTLKEYKIGYGADIFLTNVGFGFGGYYQNFLTRTSQIEVSLHFSSLRNSDETIVRVVDPVDNTIEYVYKNKINRLYRMPVTVSYKRHILTKTLGSGFKPFLVGGLGGTLIMDIPYKNFENEFFEALNYPEFYIKPTVMGGVGLDFGMNSSKRMSVYLNYLYTPPGGDRIISIENLPIDNCGGIFLGIKLGAAN